MPSTADHNESLRRRVASHVHWGLRHVFRGRMVVDVKKIEAGSQEMVIDIGVRVAHWTGSALDEMDAALAGELPSVDEVYACLHELVELMPRPGVTGPRGPGLFEPVSNDRAVALNQVLARARGLL